MHSKNCLNLFWVIRGKKLTWKCNFTDFFGYFWLVLSVIDTLSVTLLSDGILSENIINLRFSRLQQIEILSLFHCFFGNTIWLIGNKLLQKLKWINRNWKLNIEVACSWLLTLYVRCRIYNKINLQLPFFVLVYLPNIINKWVRVYQSVLILFKDDEKVFLGVSWLKIQLLVPKWSTLRSVDKIYFVFFFHL